MEALNSVLVFINSVHLVHKVCVQHCINYANQAVKEGNKKAFICFMKLRKYDEMEHIPKKELF